MPPATVPKASEPDFFSSGVERVRRFYLSREVQQKSGLQVVSGGWERVSADYRVRRSSFPYLTLEFVAAGEGALILNGKPHALTAGALFTYSPRVAHEITTSRQRPLLKYFVNLAGTQGKRLLEEASLSPGTFRFADNPEPLRQHFDRMIAACLIPGPHRARVAALHAELLLLGAASEAAPGEDRTQSHATYLRCRSYLEREYVTVGTAEEGARACRVDPAYLCRLFAKFGEESPYQFLLRLKMEHAARALEHGESVKEVAAQLSMNPFHFSRTFRRHHGRPPSHHLSLRPAAP